MDVDVAKTAVASAPLDWVGMKRIQCPVLIPQADGTVERAPALVDAFVSLDEAVKGIHMSRLFVAVEKHLTSSPLSPDLLTKITNDFLESHRGISRSALVKVSFDYMIQRPSLISKNSGWRSYPVTLWASIQNRERAGADFVVEYSSTCPCSAALARQLIQKQFDEDFAEKASLNFDEVRNWLGTEQAINGTPHGQRSEGRIQLELGSSELHSFDFLSRSIVALEEALATPVQTVVKREDEQQFAHLNARNLMFAEDAVRRMHQCLKDLGLFTGIAVEACHLESLHPHNCCNR